MRTWASGTADRRSCSTPGFFHLPGDPQSEPVAIEGDAAIGLGRGDRGVIDAEEQQVLLLPARLALAGRILDQFERMTRSGSRK